jgi:hypothetical protein
MTLEVVVMIQITNVDVLGWEAAIRGMRNPLNSWDKSDTLMIPYSLCDSVDNLNLADICGGVAPIIKTNDYDLMKRLAGAGSDHAKYRRMIILYADILAPLYWWKEYDTYKVGTVANSCSTMHKIQDKEFTPDDFSHEKLDFRSYCMLKDIVNLLNKNREFFIETKDKRYWWNMIQLLPSSYNQRRTVQLNYEVLVNVYHSRKSHKLDEWRKFCNWVESLPYSEIITGGGSNE